jgi:uncharacterized protein (TIGR04222 family)
VVADAWDRLVVTMLPPTEILLLHVALALAALTLVGSARWWIRRGANHDMPSRPVELAYLNNGPRLVVFTGLAALRHHGMVRIDTNGIVTVSGAALPGRASWLHSALLATLRQPRSGADLLSDDNLAAATDVIGTRLVRRGWILSAKLQARMPWYGIPGWIVAVWCSVAFTLTVPRFSEPGRPMQALGLLGLTVVLAVGTFLVIDVPPTTRAGQAALRRARAKLHDRQRETVSWPMRVAVYGEPELWRLDADFARRAGAFSGKLPPFSPTRRRTFISRDWWQRMV